jgi:hypothetical protein
MRRYLVEETAFAASAYSAHADLEQTQDLGIPDRTMAMLYASFYLLGHRFWSSC